MLFRIVAFHRCFPHELTEELRMRGDQLARQWRVLRQIEGSPQGLTATEIAGFAGVSLRTAYRDLDDLQFAGFPLFTEKGPQGQRWKFVESYQFKVPQPFTFTELLSLHLSRDLFKVFTGTVFYDSLASLFEKIRATLPPQALAYLDRMQSIFHMSLRPYKDYEKYRELICQVNQAAAECRCIEIAYQPLRDKAETVRRLDPYKIWFFDGTIYLIGFCHLRKEIRTFVLDRIKMLRPTDDTFEMPADFDLSEYMRHSFKVMHDSLHEVKIRISPDWSRYVGERIWHESQRAEKCEDGSLVMTFHVAGLDEIKLWVMGLGPEAIVISPDELRELVASDLKRALIQYGLPSKIHHAIETDENRTDYGT